MRSGSRWLMGLPEKFAFIIRKQCRELRGLYSVRDSRGKLTHRQRDFIGEVRAWGRCFLLRLENQEKINLTFPWRLMELDCLAYRQEIEKISGRSQEAGKSGRKTRRFCGRSQEAGKSGRESGETCVENQGAEERRRLIREISGRNQDDLNLLGESLRKIVNKLNELWIICCYHQDQVIHFVFLYSVLQNDYLEAPDEFCAVEGICRACSRDAVGKAFR